MITAQNLCFIQMHGLVQMVDVSRSVADPLNDSDINTWQTRYFSSA